MKWIKTYENFEANSNEIDYTKYVYNPDNKTITCIYKIVDKDDESVTIENIQEIQEYTGMQPFSGVTGKGKPVVYMDGKISGLRITRLISIPKNLIQIGKELPGGFCEITIPYSFYKKNEKSLKVKKLDGKDFRIKDIKDNLEIIEDYI